MHTVRYGEGSVISKPQRPLIGEYGEAAAALIDGLINVTGGF
jgi:hypothetical protein